MAKDYMTTSEFEVLAKAIVAEKIEKDYGIIIRPNDLEFVWFAHELGYKKCTLYTEELGHYYPEVTYNRDKNEIYVDIYLKQSNIKINSKDFDKYCDLYFSFS